MKVIILVINYISMALPNIQMDFILFLYLMIGDFLKNLSKFFFGLLLLQYLNFQNFSKINAIRERNIKIAVR